MSVVGQTGVPDLSTIGDALQNPNRTWSDVVVFVAIVVVSIVVARLVRWLIERVLSTSRTDRMVGELVGRVAGYVVVGFGLVYALESLGIAIAPLLGALGVAGIALAFALQSILENFIAGVILQMRRPFTKGDEVEIAGCTGSITRVDGRTVGLLTPNGDVVRVPSSEVLKNPIVNHTRNGRRRSLISVGVAYSSDLDQVVSVATEAAGAQPTVLSDSPPTVLVAEFGDSSIELSVRFWHGPSLREAWAARDQVARAISRAFRQHDIEIPFPQRVLHTPALTPNDGAAWRNGLPAAIALVDA